MAASREFDADQRLGAEINRLDSVVAPSVYLGIASLESIDRIVPDGRISPRATGHRGEDRIVDIETNPSYPGTTG